MKNIVLLAVALICFSTGSAQTNEADFNTTSDLVMTTDYGSDSPEINDLMSFQGIDFMKVNFSGKELTGKSYHITVKEIWNGKVISDSTVFNSKTIGIKQFETLNDSIFSMRIIAQHTDNNLRVKFKFPRFSITKDYRATNSEDYSLRNLVDESKLPIGYNEKFYFLAYILPYEREDGSKSWCDVGTSGDTIETWGEKFGIEHYLLFEMKFE